MTRLAIKGASADAWAFAFFVLSSFIFMFAGVGAGRMFLSAATMCWLFDRVVYHKKVRCTPAAGWMLAYVAWITVALCWAPAESTVQFNHFYRQLSWLALPVGASLLSSEARRKAFFSALALGSTVLAFRVLYAGVRTVVWAQQKGISVDGEHWVERVFHHRLLDGSDVISLLVTQGGMQDGQRLAVGLIALSACGLIWNGCRLRKTARTVAIALVLLAFALSFKRGPWLAFAVIAVLHVAGGRAVRLSGSVRGAKRGLAVLSLLLVTGAAIWWMQTDHAPLREAVRVRVENARAAGGRTCMWLGVTPELVRRHPFGIGFKTLTNEQMREIAPHVERGQTHVHSNILQSAIDGGWVGAFLFLGWMIAVFYDVMRYRKQAPPGGADAKMADALFYMLFALALMGLVEYQIGSGQMVLIYGALMGCASAGALPPAPPSKQEHRHA